MTAPMAERSDENLLAACRQGDEQAWATLVERYAPLILSIPSRYGLRAAERDDVFADVCLALVRSLGAIRDPQSLPKWLISTATRATWEFTRKHHRPLPDDLPPLTGAAPPDHFASALEEEHLVRRALRRVGGKCRRLLELLYFSARRHSYDDIARSMRIPRGSLGPTRRRCLDKLRRDLGPELGGDVSSPPLSPPR